MPMEAMMMMMMIMMMIRKGRGDYDNDPESLARQAITEETCRLHNEWTQGDQAILFSTDGNSK
jgi:hypothetical protein